MKHLKTFEETKVLPTAEDVVTNIVWNFQNFQIFSTVS